MIFIVLGSILGGAVIGCSALLFFQRRGLKFYNFKRTKRFLVVFDTENGGQARRAFEKMSSSGLKGVTKLLDGDNVRGIK